MAVLPDPPWPANKSNLAPNFRRQTPDGDINCDDQSNGVISCFPTSSTVVVQNTSMHFVWNQKQPAFAQFDQVDVYLFHQDSLKLATSQIDIPNSPGRTAFAVNDSWWDQRGDNFNGTNITYPMYFVIVQHGQPVTAEPPQSTFTAIQTRVPDSILAQMAQSSAAAASSSIAEASLSSILATPTSTLGSRTASTPSETGKNTDSSGGLQTSSEGSGFPAWAIALLVIFGTLALVFVLLAFWLGLRRYRRRTGRGRGSPNRNGSLHESMGSHTPMMAEVAPTGNGDEPGSPGALSSSQGHQSFIPPGALAIAGSGAAGAAGSSRAGSTHTKDTDAPFSGADAAIMAAAFRDRLRKPDFANRPLEEGDSPDKDNDSEEERELFLQSQLREEGKDLRSVASNKGVRIQKEGDAPGIDNGSMSTFHDRGRGLSADSDLPSVDLG